MRRASNSRLFLRHRYRPKEIHYHINSIEGTNIAIGNTSSDFTMTATNGGDTLLSERELELIRIFRLADERRKNEAMRYFFTLEENMREATGNG